VSSRGQADEADDEVDGDGDDGASGVRAPVG